MTKYYHISGNLLACAAVGLLGELLEQFAIRPRALSANLSNSLTIIRHSAGRSSAYRPSAQINSAFLLHALHVS